MSSHTFARDTGRYLNAKIEIEIVLCALLVGSVNRITVTERIKAPFLVSGASGA